MASTSNHRREFTQRLNLACDRNPNIPPKNKGRQQFIANALSLAPEAVSKWFRGDSMPRHKKMCELAELLGVEVTWLHFGEEPLVGRSERKTAMRRAEGAAHVLWGFIEMAGGFCGVLPENDPRAEAVSFVTTLDGMVYLVFVTLAKEVGPNFYEAIIPEECHGSRVFVAIRTSGDKVSFFEISDEQLEDATPFGNNRKIVIERIASSKFAFNGNKLIRVTDFARLV